MEFFGQTGCGKTTGPGAALIKTFLEGGFGGLILTAKQEEREGWEQAVREGGREGDLAIIEGEDQ